MSVSGPTPIPYLAATMGGNYVPRLVDLSTSSRGVGAWNIRKCSLAVGMQWGLGVRDARDSWVRLGWDRDPGSGLRWWRSGVSARILSGDELA